MCSFMHDTTESATCSYPHAQEKQREKSWKTTRRELLVIHVSSFVSHDEPNQKKNLHVKHFFPFILPCHFVETVQKKRIDLAILNPNVQVICPRYPNMAEQ